MDVVKRRSVHGKASSLVWAWGGSAMSINPDEGSGLVHGRLEDGRGEAGHLGDTNGVSGGRGALVRRWGVEGYGRSYTTEEYMALTLLPVLGRKAAGGVWPMDCQYSSMISLVSTPGDTRFLRGSHVFFSDG